VVAGLRAGGATSSPVSRLIPSLSIGRPRVIAEAGIGWLGGALATKLAALAVLRLAGRWSRSAAGRGVGVATARDL
jgi:hypothetical protein